MKIINHSCSLKPPEGAEVVAALTFTDDCLVLELTDEEYNQLALTGITHYSGEFKEEKDVEFEYLMYRPARIPWKTINRR